MASHFYLLFTVVLEKSICLYYNYQIIDRYAYGVEERLIMKQKSRLQTVVGISYTVVSVLFVFFMIYMYFFESSSVYSARNTGSCNIVENYTVRQVADSSAPVGFRREYSWTLDDISDSDSCLIFYLVHHYAEVRFDDELIYSLMPGENNRIGGSPGSNWVVIPVCQSDSGRKVSVTVTPVYKSVINREIQFEIGPRYTVMAQRLKADLPQIVLSSLCILLGLVLVFVNTYLVLRKKDSSWKVAFLGNFLLLIGLWRITDTRFSPVMFSSNPMALGYITLAILSIICVPLMLFVKERYTARKRTVLLATVLINCIVALSVLICQVFGIAELRQTLTVSHVMLIFNIAVLLLISLLRDRKETENGGLWKFVVLISAGALADLIYFYLKGSSSGILFTIIAILIYTVFQVVTDIYKMNKKAYTDVHTGLFNKSRWDELMEDKTPDTEPIGIIMFDLNRLKHTNDTMGHKVGDKMIYNFANVLRNTIPPSNTICRWGGDEFTVLVTGADSDKMEKYVSAVTAAVDAYNVSGEKPVINFAAGWALSSDFPC